MGKPICIEHPVLYDLCENKLITVQEMLTRNGRLNFIRWLPPSLFEDWMRIVEMTFSFKFEARDDFVSNGVGAVKRFSPRNMYIIICLVLVKIIISITSGSQNYLSK